MAIFKGHSLVQQSCSLVEVYSAVLFHRGVLVFRDGSLSCSIWYESLLSGRTITPKSSLNHLRLSLGWYSEQKKKRKEAICSSPSLELDDPFTKEAFKTILTHQVLLFFCLHNCSDLSLFCKISLSVAYCTLILISILYRPICIMLEIV